MKKGKVFTSGQLALVAMVLVLGAAVWLNTRYSGKLAQKTKYLGETALVGSDVSSEAVPTAAKPTETEDYFERSAQKRDAAYQEAEETAEAMLKNESLSTEERKSATESLAKLAKRKVDEAEIENLLTAKGFQKNLVVINDTGVTVVVQSEGLLASQTVQIQDVVTAQCGVGLNNVKIVTVDG